MTALRNHIIPMILAAGLGTRLGSLTYNKPKALVSINGKTLLEIAMRRLKDFGFDEVIINIHHFGDQIVSYLGECDNFGMNVLISDETDMLMDTGGALIKARTKIPEGKSLLVHNVDVITSINLSDLIARHFNEGNDATLVVRKRDSSRKLLFDQQRQLVGWLNTVSGELKKVNDEMPLAASELAFSGIHIINPSDLNPFASVPCSVIDVYLTLAKTKKIRAYLDDSDTWVDVGKAEQLKQLNDQTQIS
jgi:NDP-sugar pyrophosphorylase family protein